jgi:hypothetical protein
MQLMLRKYYQDLSQMCFLITFCNQIADTGKLFAQYQNFDHFDPKKGIFDPPISLIFGQK